MNEPKKRSTVGDERIAWIATWVWLVVVLVAVRWHGAGYDPSAKLDIHDWSEVATIVSGIAAPIAVLWVVRSFYVQKKELASAVEAATHQSKEFALQNQLTLSQFHPWLTAELTTLGSSAGGKVEPDGRVQKGVTVITFTVSNAGPGIAHNVRFETLGVRSGAAVWAITAVIAYSLAAEGKTTFTQSRPFYADSENPEEVIFAVTCVDALREQHRFAFRQSRLGHSTAMDYEEFVAIRGQLQ